LDCVKVSNGLGKVFRYLTLSDPFFQKRITIELYLPQIIDSAFTDATFLTNPPIILELE
jgi:hypothetical protein